MQKTKLVTISPITCSKGHTFYPKVLPDGTVRIPDKCMIRNCRVYLDHKKVQKGIAKRQLNLNHKTQSTTKPFIPTVTIVNHKERPLCRICNVTFYDEKNLKIHNERLHKQR